MNREYIIAIAREAGWEMPVDWDVTDGFLMHLERFTALLEKKIRADEREACAEVCMSVSGKYIGVGAGASPWSFGASEAASKCAKYIRARGKK